MRLVNGTNTQEAAGQTLGEGIGNIWFVAKPDYTIMLVNAQLVGHDTKSYKSDYTEGIGKTTYFTDDREVTLYTFKLDSLNKNKLQKSIFQTTMFGQFMKLIKLLFLQPLTKRILDPLMYLEKHSLHTMDGRCTILDRTVKPGDSTKG